MLPYASNDNAKMIRVLEENLEEIDKLYDSRPSGVNRALAYFFRVNDLLAQEVKGVFTDAEIKAMVDNENGVLVDQRTWGNKRMFMYSLEDGFKLNKLGEKWQVDLDEIKQKIESLSDAAFLYLHEEIYRFWNEAPAYGSPTPDLDSITKKLC